MLGSTCLIAYDVWQVLRGEYTPYDEFQVARMPGSNEIFITTLNGDLYKLTVEKVLNLEE